MLRNLFVKNIRKTDCLQKKVRPITSFNTFLQPG